MQKSEQGAKIADSSGVVLKNIVESVKKVSDLNQEIATGSQEQATGISQISNAMNQLDSATQGNAASSEEIAASSEEMFAQANTLQGLVQQLVRLVQGGTHDNQNQVNHQLQASRGASVARSKSAQVIPFEPRHAEVDKRAVGSTDGF